MKGIITNLKIDRGFGFIDADDGRSVFFHVNALQRPLDFDETLVQRRVEFSVQETPKGPTARNLRAADW